MYQPGRSLVGLGFLILTILIITHPHSSYTAAATALSAWWKVVIPALLPFFLVSHLLSRLGLIQFLGVFLEPVTRTLFRLPGPAALVIALGYSSGPPVAASMVAGLRRQQLVSRKEGEKLLCFAHNASPLFMLGAVSAGMLGNPAFGPPLALSHYLANLTLGLLWRQYGTYHSGTSTERRGDYWRRALAALRQTQEKENCPLGSIVAEAISKSFETLVLVGGYITLAAVALALMRDLHVLPVLDRCLTPFLQCLGLAGSLSEALASGLVEMTIGTLSAAESSAPLPDRLKLICLILGWSGLAVHGQVAGVLAGTDIRLGPFLLSRIGQGILAALYLPLFLPQDLEVFLPLARITFPGSWVVLCSSLKLLCAGLALPCVAALAYHTFRRCGNADS